MSDRFTRITVPLSREEFSALRDSALKDYRHPRDQARHLLRRFLLGSSDHLSNDNTVNVDRQTEQAVPA